MKLSINKRNHLERYHLGIFLIFCIVFGSTTLFSCSSNTDDDGPDTPPKVSYFLTQYFPGRAIESITESSSGSFTATIKNGPIITFNSDGDWQSINGEGETLPEVLLFDQLPPQLYEYIQGLDSTNQVFSLNRSGGDYTALLLNTTVRYNSTTGNITEV